MNCRKKNCDRMQKISLYVLPVLRKANDKRYIDRLIDKTNEMVPFFIFVVEIAQKIQGSFKYSCKTKPIWRILFKLKG